MAVKDRIYNEIVQTIHTRLAEWRDERESLRKVVLRIAELDEMIGEAERELEVAELKLPRSG